LKLYKNKRIIFMIWEGKFPITGKTSKSCI